MQSVTWDGDKIEEQTGTHIQWRFWSLLVVSNIRICLDFKCFAYHMTLHEVELPLPISASISTYHLSRRCVEAETRRAELPHVLIPVRSQSGAWKQYSHVRRLHANSSKTKVVRLSRCWAGQLYTAGGSELQFLLLLWWAEQRGHCAPALSVLQPPHVQYNAL